MSYDNNYRQQVEANIIDFYNNSGFHERRNTLFKISALFDKEQVDWALICSSNLFFQGIVDDFHDFDILVSQKSLPKVVELMNGPLNAQLLETGGNGYCESDCYMHYVLGECHIDILCGFRLKTFGTEYYYQFSKREMDSLNSEYFDVPLVPLEAQLVLYAMMEGWQQRRKFKRKLIFEALNTLGVKYPQILTNALEKFQLLYLHEVLQSMLKFFHCLLKLHNPIILKIHLTFLSDLSLSLKYVSLLSFLLNLNTRIPFFLTALFQFLLNILLQ